MDNLAARRNVFPCKCHRLYPKNTHTHTCTHGYTRISNHRGIRGRAGLDPTSFFAYFPPRYRRECIAKRYTPTLPLATIRPVSSRICSNTLAKPAQWNVHLRDRVRATFIRICNHLRDPPPPTLMKLIPGIIGTRFTIPLPLLLFITKGYNNRVNFFIVLLSKTLGEYISMSFAYLLERNARVRNNGGGGNANSSIRCDTFS